MSESLFGDIEIHYADRTPCPVCGHPTSDCTDGKKQIPVKPIGVGLFPSLDKDLTFLVEEDFYIDEIVADKTTRRMKRFTNGQIISLLLAREYGLTK